MKTQSRSFLRLALLASAALPLLTAPEVIAHPRHHHGLHGHSGYYGRSGHYGFRFHGHDAHHGYADEYASRDGRTVWRFHGLDHGGRYDYAPGSVRRHHGPGHGGYDGRGVSRHHGLGYSSYHPAFYDRDDRTDAATDERRASRSAARAWALLNGAEAGHALRAFAELAPQRPGDATIKAGFALSAAMLGQHDIAIWTMRRAVSADAPTLRSLPIEETLENRMRGLIGHYGYEATEPAANVDAMFMMAALHYLLGEDDAALSAIDEAVERGDRSAGTNALYELLAPQQGPPAPHDGVR